MWFARPQVRSRSLDASVKRTAITIAANGAGGRRTVAWSRDMALWRADASGKLAPCRPSRSVERQRRPKTDRAKPRPIRHQAARRRVLVRAALRAAVERPVAPFVLAALRAAAERSDGARRDAACLACLESDLCEALRLGSRFRTRVTARDTRGRRRVLRLCCPAA
jgi:hypothetical protein